MAFAFDAEEFVEKLLPQALYVDKSVNFEIDESQPPTTAQEYLRRVMKESQTVDQVAIASNIQEILCKGSVPEAPTHFERTKENAPISLLPDKDWVNKQVSEFVDLRQVLERSVSYDSITEPTIKVPKKTDEHGWCIFCYGEAFWNLVEAARKALDSSEESNPDEKLETKKAKKSAKKYKQEAPSTEVLCQLRPTEIEKVLEYQIEWAQLVGVKAPEQGLWIYSLLARIEKPLFPDIVSSMRTLVEICCKERNLIGSQLSDQNLNEGMLVHLNLLITLITKYFGQTDLAD